MELNSDRLRKDETSSHVPMADEGLLTSRERLNMSSKRKTSGNLPHFSDEALAPKPPPAGATFDCGRFQR